MANRRTIRTADRAEFSPDEGLRFLWWSGTSYDGQTFVLKVPVSEQIRQLIVSPDGKFLAIATSHTVHVALLPDSSHLGQPDSDPIRLKTHTIGPTSHVLSQSPVVSALWHPLGVSGRCLVTVTAEAVVRVWELNPENRWSFDKPTLAIDLKKLANATTSDEDVSPYTIGRNKGFSPDSFEMEVAAACFGGTGSEEEDGWPSMTLWIAMREGDVYALCPLLPSKWQPASTLIPSLAASMGAKAAAMEDDDIPDLERGIYEQQSTWFSAIDSQEPTMTPGESEFAPDIEIYSRPKDPGPIARLQGPFEIEGTPDESKVAFHERITDIVVVGSTTDADELNANEAEEESNLDQPQLSADIICLLSNTGRLQVCLALIDVEGQWLPKKDATTMLDFSSDPLPILLNFETIETTLPADKKEISWPTFCTDVQSRYSLFISHENGLSFISFLPWIANLEGELQSVGGAGSEFRIERFTEGPKSLYERVLSLGSKYDEKLGHTSEEISGCIVLEDSDLGYFLLAVSGEQPQALQFDVAGPRPLTDEGEGLSMSFEATIEALPTPRSAYQPPASLWSPSELPTFLETHVHDRHRRMLREEIRLSSAILELITEAHRLLSNETYRLGVAAADLFRRCERLQDEFRDQIRRAREVKYLIEKEIGDDVDTCNDNELLGGNSRIDQRIEGISARQVELVARHDSLRRKIAHLDGRALSDKEQLWIQEMQKMASAIIPPEDRNSDDDDHESVDQKSAAWRRLRELRDVMEDLVPQAKEAANDGECDENGTFKVPPAIRKAKESQIMGMLERESALIEATQSRLERLEVSDN
ncbi:MAG: hypothetical protein M1819_006769 [Sarea resinae]|nr:MAG: hypothetical protein M1819_006769 [Sarea resinae]